MEKMPLKVRVATETLPAGYELDKLVHAAQKMEEKTIRRWRMAHTLSKSGDLWTKDGTFVVVGNNALKRGVISLFHDSTTAGHPGITKTLTAIKPYYWWPGIKNFVTEYVKGCITDYDCSKVAIFISCNEEIDAAGVAKVYATYVFPHYGLPRKVISD